MPAPLPPTAEARGHRLPPSHPFGERGRRPRVRRVAIAGMALAPLAVGLTSARAAWQSPGSGGPAIAGEVMPAGAVPTVAASGQNVTASWAAGSMSSVAVSYQVRRYDATTGVQQTIGTGCSAVSATLTCTETGLPAGNWKYTVTPVYATWAGAQSSRSATVTTPPPAPAGVSATASSPSAITVTWSAAAGATGYQVLRSTVTGGPYTLVATPTTTSFGDTGLAASTAYFYVVKSTFNGAVSPASGQAGATTNAAVLTNAGFETGSLSSWTSAPAPSSPGTTSVQTSFNGYAAHGGSYFAVVFPGAQDTYAHLSQSFTVAAGQTISGWAFFDGEDYMPFNDDGAVVIQQNGSDVATVFAASIGVLGDNGRTGWTFWSYTAPSSGMYAVDARVRNVTDGAGDSYFGIDDVAVQ